MKYLAVDSHTLDEDLVEVNVSLGLKGIQRVIIKNKNDKILDAAITAVKMLRKKKKLVYCNAMFRWRPPSSGVMPLNCMTERE
jgi:hypothetical protein